MPSSLIFGGDNLADNLQNGEVTADGQEITSGRRSKNFIRNRSGYRNTNGWTVSGACTVTRTTTSAEIVDGVASLKFAAGSAADYVKNAFTINNIQKGLPLNISFDFITQSGTAGDWDVVIYDVTAAATIPVSAPSQGGSGGNLAAGNGTFNAFFIASTNTSYELRIVRKGGSGTFSAANFDVFLQQVRVGAPVTDSVSFAPTSSSGLGTLASTQAYCWRSGENMFLQVRFTTGTTAAAEARFDLPNGLAVSSKLSALTMAGQWFRNSSTANDRKQGAILAQSGNTYLKFASDDYVPAVSPFAAQNGSTLFNSAEVVTFIAVVPIETWSSNTQMADRAVEEFAYNTDVSATASVTGSGFANGAAGIAFNANWSTNTQWIRRCRFQTPIQATDKLELEVLENGTWYKASDRMPYIRQSGTLFGARVVPVSSSTTDIDAYFEAGGAAPSNATYAGNGLLFSNFTALNWRVRKVSSGAQIAGAISTANIVGRVDGNAPGTGYLGEAVVTNSAGVAAAASGSYATVATITLQSGRWLVFGTGALTLTASTGITQIVVGISKNTTSFDVTNANNIFQSSPASTQNQAYTVGPRLFDVAPGTTQSVSLIGAITYSTITATWNTSSSLLPVRIC